LYWRYTSDAHVGAFIAISPEPARGVILNIFDAVKVVSAQLLGSDGAIVALDIGVLLRVAWLDIHQRNSGFLSPVLQCATDVFSGRCPREWQVVFLANL